MIISSFGLNSNNDIFINASGNLQVDTNLQAVADACVNVSRALLGEEVLTTGKGLPYFQSIFTGAPNIANFQNYLTSQLNGVDGVTAVTNVSISIANNVLSFIANISTEFGPTSISNAVALQ